MTKQQSALLLYPHQLFEDAIKQSQSSIVILVEDDLFFTQYTFHKQKLILHRASMQAFAHRLKDEGIAVEYIETSKTTSMDQLERKLRKLNITNISYYDLVDDWLEQRVSALIKKLDIAFETLTSPGFLTNKGMIEEYFSNHPNRMQSFYEWQRKRLDVLIKNSKPIGGKWSFDDQNRKPLPKTIELPKEYDYEKSSYVTDAQKWVAEHFADNPGTTDFKYPITHAQAYDRLEQFLKERLELFGPYEDAIAKDQIELFHSVLSPLLNNGLLTPRQVVTRALQFAKKNDTPINSLEGFIRQIIGWREYMRATYVQYGRTMRSQNELKFKRKLDESWWNATTGLQPIDTTIERVLDTAYAHHIERLMVLGNAMILLRINPDDVYQWFMEMFIDAYDWVMVPNVYAMSQFAAGNLITTKPYISGSNYIVKMSDYKKEEWAEVWDALYWRFIADHKSLFENNYRSAMMVKLYDKLAPEKKRAITQTSNKWLP